MSQSRSHWDETIAKSKVIVIFSVFLSFSSRSRSLLHFSLLRWAALAVYCCCSIADVLTLWKGFFYDYFIHYITRPSIKSVEWREIKNYTHELNANWVALAVASNSWCLCFPLSPLMSTKNLIIQLIVNVLELIRWLRMWDKELRFNSA